MDKFKPNPSQPVSDDTMAVPSWFLNAINDGKIKFIHNGMFLGNVEIKDGDWLIRKDDGSIELWTEIEFNIKWTE